MSRREEGYSCDPRYDAEPHRQCGERHEKVGNKYSEENGNRQRKPEPFTEEGDKAVEGRGDGYCDGNAEGTGDGTYRDIEAGVNSKESFPLPSGQGAEARRFCKGHPGQQAHANEIHAADPAV